MAVQVRSLFGSRAGFVATPSIPTEVIDGQGLSFSQRFNLSVRRRRVQKLRAAVETAIWVSGSAVLITIAMAGVVGLR